MGIQSETRGLTRKRAKAFWVKTLLTTTFVLIPLTVYAVPFKIVGSRPLGMGGAFVAIGEGAIGQHWNPAGLVTEGTWDLELDVGANAEFTKNLLKKADDIAELSSEIDNVQSKQGSSTLELSDYNSFAKAVNKISGLNEKGLGVLLGGNGGLNMRLWKFGVSVNRFVDVSGDPFVDLENVGLFDLTTGGVKDGIGVANTAAGTGCNPSDPCGQVSTQVRNDLEAMVTDASSRLGIDLSSFGGDPVSATNAIINEAATTGGLTTTQIESSITEATTNYNEVKSQLPSGIGGAGSFDDNKTNVTLRGAMVDEVAFGMGSRLPKKWVKKQPWLEPFAVGGNIKIMKGEVGFAEILVIDEDVDAGQVRSDFTKKTRTSTQLGLDLGFLYDLKEKYNFRAGLVAKNINSPSFESPAGGTDIKYEQQVRFGLAYWLFKRWVFALDYDVLKNKTSLPDYDSQMLSVGTEFKLINSRKFDIALRGGYLTNMGESASEPTYTGGLGLTFLNTSLEVSAGVSPENVEVEGADKVPANLYVSAAFTMGF